MTNVGYASMHLPLDSWIPHPSSFPPPVKTLLHPQLPVYILSLRIGRHLKVVSYYQLPLTQKFAAPRLPSTRFGQALRGIRCNSQKHLVLPKFVL